MEIKYNSYNVPKVDIGTITDSTKTEIGTDVDLKKLTKLVDESGVMQITFKISTTVYVASVNATVKTAGIEIGGIILSSGSPVIVSGLLEDGTGKAYATIGITSLTNANANAKVAKSAK